MPDISPSQSLMPLTFVPSPATTLVESVTGLFFADARRSAAEMALFDEIMELVLAEVEPLARRLGVTKGSFYWHFPSRDALLQALPSQRLLHLRYPADLAQWYPTTATLAQALSATPPPAARIGLHNDCFLASSDDVGTYFAETTAESQTLRSYAQQASAVTGAGGETCAPPEPAQARMT